MVSLIKKMSIPIPQKKRANTVINDFVRGIKNWRIWMTLAMFDIRARYRRSKIGQFWITISMAVTICSLAVIYSAIFKIELAIYLPLVAVSFIVWGLIATLINDAALIYIQSEGYILSSPLPISTFIYRMLARNAIIFAHNLVLVPIVMILFGIIPSLTILFFIPALLLALLNAIWLAMTLGVLCCRFRDMPQIVSSIVQIAFFVSPVMWERHQLDASRQFIIDWNPFAVFLELLRGPWLGKISNLSTWGMAIAITVIGFLIAIPFFAKFRSRIAFYL